VKALALALLAVAFVGCGDAPCDGGPFITDDHPCGTNVGAYPAYLCKGLDDDTAVFIVVTNAKGETSTAVCVAACPAVTP